MTAGVSLGVIGIQGNLGGGLVERGDGWSVWSPACGCTQFSKPVATSVSVVSVKRLGKFRGGVRLNLVRFAAGRDEEQQWQQQQGRSSRRPRDVCSVLSSRRHGEGARGIARNSAYYPSGLQRLELKLVPDLGSSAKVKLGRQGVRCSVGVAPLEEPKPDADDHSREQEQHQEQHSIGSVAGENFSGKPGHVSAVPEEVLSQVGGKAGSISFYSRRSDSVSEERGGESVAPSPSSDSVSEERGGESVAPSPSSGSFQSLIWPLGPFILVASVVLPPLYLRKIFGALLEDSLVTDFVILFFTETLFFVGASLFLYIAHISRLAAPAVAAALEQKPASPVVYSYGYRLSAKLALGAGVLLPLATFVMVWPWTGPAAAAALAPYMIGLLVQIGFERVIHSNDSPVWPLVPVTFQMYRLHQLNRAAQLVAGLLFSLKGVEATAETMAINGSLQTLLFVLQVLGMLCLWSLGSFLTNHLPSQRGQTSIPCLP